MSSPLVDWAGRLPGRLQDTITRAVAPIQHPIQTLQGMMAPPQKPDTSWHDQAVRDANQSHSDAMKPKGVLTQAARRPVR